MFPIQQDACDQKRTDNPLGISPSAVIETISNGKTTAEDPRFDIPQEDQISVLKMDDEFY